MEFESRLAGFRSRPFALKQLLWPNVRFFNKQVEVIESVRDNVETYVPAGNMLGKDFVTGFIVLWTFLSWRNVKIVTTSATDLQLDVLWGEIDWFIRQSVYPLLHPRGPLVYNNRELRKVIDGVVNQDIYACSRVVTSGKKGEGLSGHHQEHTLFVGDEASGLPDVAYEMAQGWAKRFLFIGNPNPCNNFFKKGVEAGDLIAS